jgi:hypothetical protein
MSCIVIRIYSFECDHPGCDCVEEVDGVYDKPDAERHLRDRGWTVRNRKHYCPTHGTKAGTR